MGTEGTRSAGTGRRAILAIVTAMMFLLPAMLLLPNSAGAGPGGMPTLFIKVEPPSQEAVVSPSAQGSVEFCGTVQVQHIIGPVTITLMSSVDGGWASQCAPSTMEVRNESAVNFSVTVIVPQATPASIIGTLKVDARGQGTGYVITASCQAMITVKPYYRFSLNCTSPYQQIKPGNQAEFDVKVINEGNSVDSFELEIENQKELESKGWTITLSTAQVSGVQPLQNASFKVSAQSPKTNITSVWTLVSESDILYASARFKHGDPPDMGMTKKPPAISM